MDDGKIITQGSYDDIKDNNKLQNLLNINKINNGTPNRETESAQKIYEEDPLENMGERDNKINYSEALKQSSMSSVIQKSDDIPDLEKLKIFENLGRVTEKDDGKIIKYENEEIINVKLADYMVLLRTSGGWPQIFLLQLIMAGFTWCKIQTDYTIGEWARLETESEQ